MQYYGDSLEWLCNKRDVVSARILEGELHIHMFDQTPSKRFISKSPYVFMSRFKTTLMLQKSINRSGDGILIASVLSMSKLILNEGIFDCKFVTT